MTRSSALHKTTIVFAALFVSVFAAAQSTTGATGATPSGSLEIDQQAYCQYITEQAAAQRDLLRTPSAVSGFTQPNTGLPAQAVFGVTGSLSNIRKAGLTMDVAQRNCDLYSATTDAQQKIQYAVPSLEKAALGHRLDLIADASDQLDATIAATAKMVESQNATRPMLFALQTTKIKLEADKADTQSKIATLYVPDLSTAPLKQLVALQQSTQSDTQAALDKLNRQNNWDVALAVGAHQQLSPVDSTGAYGEVTVSYNLGSHAINKHLDQAAKAYSGWKNVQENDVVRNAEVLRRQITDGIAAQTTRLKSLEDQAKQIESNQQLVADAQTSAALDFQNQLTSARLLLGIEIGDATFRLAELQAFERDNY
ncbi:MAG TPA: hypothetical protein VKW06_15050 [Candidatus Angelobacter sp.]|nr:hypothetical protein [Candidatus Angelobacter sp.]